MYWRVHGFVASLQLVLPPPSPQTPPCTADQTWSLHCLLLLFCTAQNPENLEWHAAFHRLRRFKALKGGTLLQQETQSQQQQEDSMPGGQNNAPVAQGNGSSTSSRQYDRELGEALRWLQLQREAAKRGWLTGERSKLMMQLLGRWWVDGPGNAW